jgi:hypothetical protein
MKRSLLVLVIAMVASFVTSPGDRTAKALGASWHYTVRYNCIVGPPPPPPWDIVGEWDVDCDGNWTGWGWLPGSNCTDTEETRTGSCGGPGE